MNKLMLVTAIAVLMACGGSPEESMLADPYSADRLVGAWNADGAVFHPVDDVMNYSERMTVERVDGGVLLKGVCPDGSGQIQAVGASREPVGHGHVVCSIPTKSCPTGGALYTDIYLGVQNGDELTVNMTGRLVECSMQGDIYTRVIGHRADY